MTAIEKVKIIPILQKALNVTDQRLVDHGIRVAYLLYNVLRLEKKYTPPQMRDICLLGMLHDIGAYKTEEVDRMVIFETIDVWDHSIYGYLFIKYFSPLNDLAPVILYHHASCAEVKGINPEHAELAQLISLCDRADVYLHHSKDIDGFYSYIEKQRDIKFSSRVIDLFKTANINLHAIMDDIESDQVFLSVFFDTHLMREDVEKFIRMIIYSIDFRCSRTVIHTVTIASIARLLAKLSGVAEYEIEHINTSAMLQGVGKAGLPLSDDAGFELNKKMYADLTNEILSGNVDEDILRTAVKHHDMQRNTITLYDNILAVADVISALCYVKNNNGMYQKEKASIVLKDMCKDNLLEQKIVTLALDNFNAIIDEVNKESQAVIKYYNMIKDEYVRIRDQISAGGISELK